MTSSAPLFTFSLLCLLSLALSHSWIACTDYRAEAEQDIRYYNDSLCLGYTRNWFRRMSGPNTFGLDRGFDYKPGDVCADPLADPIENGYTDDWPMAQYQPGQKIYLAFPSKNHVAADCTNPYIPDHGMKLFISEANPSEDPSSTHSLTLLKEWAPNSGHNKFEGFQHCPAFCENMDKSLCTGHFELPEHLQRK